MEGFERKLIAGILLIMLAFLPALGFAVYSLLDLNQSQQELNQVNLKILLLAQNLKLQKVQQNSMMPIFVLSGDQFMLDLVKKSCVTFDETLADLKSLPLADQSEKSLNIIWNLEQKLRMLTGPGIDMKRRGASIGKVDTYFRENAGPTSYRIIQEIDNFIQLTSYAYDTKKVVNDQVFHTIFRILVCASFFTIVFCLVVVGLIARLVQKKKAYDQLNEQLAKRERDLSIARKTAVETVAHDLRNPLTAIIMSAAFIRERSGLPLTHTVQATLTNISLSADAMHQLIANLLDHAKIEAGSLALSRTISNIHRLLANLVARFDIIATSKEISIVNKIADTLPPVFIDTSRMEQVFSNLIGNAIKFTPRAGTICLLSDVQDHVVVISVADTGPGLKQEQANFVFERYWQGHETAHQGTGLGLAISKAIVEAHGGHIEVNSSPGSGAVFSISLPISQELVLTA